MKKMQKKIEIDLLTLIAILLIISSFIVGTIAYYNYNNRECIRDPVSFARDKSQNYWWDDVFPINYGVFEPKG